MDNIGDFIRVILKCLWLFFPAIFIITAVYYGLTSLTQGRDLILTIVESKSVAFFPILTISFWGLLTWFSSRYVAIIKMASMNRATDLLLFFFSHTPRYLGLLCFMTVEVAILQSQIIDWNIGSAASATIGLNVLLVSIGRPWVKSKKHFFQKRPYIFYGLTLSILMLSSLYLKRFDLHYRLVGIYFFLVLASMAMLIFANSRRREVNRKIFMADKVNFRKKSYFFPVIFIVLFCGLVVYLLGIFSIGFSMVIGPFNYFMLAFGVILVSSNFITWLSIKYKMSIHFLFYLGLFLVGFLIDQYQIARFSTQDSYDNRISMDEYFKRWVEDHRSDLEDSTLSQIPVIVTMADGGASRSGYWVAQVLGEIQDQLGKDFSDHLLVISGASGGSLGNVTFYNMLSQEIKYDSIYQYRKRSKEFLSHDFFTYTISRMLNPFYFLNDRATALEKAMGYANPDMEKPFIDYILTSQDKNLPILYVNTTRMQDSYPALISNIQFDEKVLNNRMDLLKLLDKRKEGIKLSTATILSCRFPYMSPAGGIGDQYFVDGGYFDNSGAGVVHETILAFEDYLKRENPLFLNKIVFKVIHIRNSRGRKSGFNRVNPMVNDIAAPILVLAASYGRQTEMNTQRLKYYLDHRMAQQNLDYWYEVALYKHTKGEKEYSMNWYMSEDCRRRMDLRFDEQVEQGGSIYRFIADFKRQKNAVK
ncbi:patatin-like phospholipase family protein [Reichenbachiella versicolor]|uniref:patatin-like phospholipase family protein n=1 Tax=Reichenbachiella versicolor TaxID=1821036 RepID=UPI000D6E7A2A|nr:patatin-like phospholipase family protein [Reichenbachiella versicolor]